MKKIIILIFGVLIPSQIFSQNNIDSNDLYMQKMYFDLQIALEKPLEVRKLNLLKNGLDSLPESISQLKNLELLILSDNNLSSLPIWIKDFEKLRYLYLDNNLFEEIPNAIFSLKNIQMLDISNNKLKRIPKKVNNVVSLQKLNISENHINFKEMQRIKTRIKNCEIID